ncbi:hypothetical protein TSOC_002642 [Tetrabaena socialis]|uniref:Uncharacterized protein n=1 Tax=Tetrabaena socialis TaxID=47790 RepID=A0A2J8ADN6_9CHLO|nr:hypothetical protein TSOC_002642 [Tetrabaena socialis]|eukprot:PNH10619.1 hypothetical protein TSOC_002642 [Tetrabaena socialis]
MLRTKAAQLAVRALKGRQATELAQQRWFAAQAASNEDEYSRFSKDTSRAHVTVPASISALKKDVEAFAMRFPSIGFEKATMRYKN